MTTTVINIHSGAPYDIYIGRPFDGTPMHYGNPFTYKAGTRALINVGSRDNALEACDQWLDGTAWHDVEPARRLWVLEHLPALDGKRLGCFCAPAACHGNLYVRRLVHVPTPYALIPSIVLAYVNSENEKDIERAHDLCARYGLDYAATRREIIERAVAESARLDAARPAKGKGR